MKRKLLKTTAVFLLLNLLLDVFFPGISYALTSGPTTPEATTFEPVDGTDMINLLTGDLAYGMPLLEVPGPEGSYPLALSYHSGLLPDEDASWVGLGWSLNPGAITRRVNGYADDHSISRINSTTLVDAGGGKAIVADAAGVSSGMGLIYQHRLHYTNGGPNMIKPMYAYFTQGSTNSFSSQDVTSTAQHDQEGYNMAFLMIYGSLPIGDGIAWDHATTVANWKFPATISKAAIVPIPEDPNLNVYLQNNYFRYFYKNSTYVDVTGSVMPSQGVAPGVSDDNIAFDSYSLIDSTVVPGDPNYNKSNEQVGGSFPAYDSYSVSAQGLSGTIQPYIFENGSLYRQNTIDNTGPYVNDLKYKRLNLFTKKVNFRFAGDFSNALNIAPEPISFTNNVSSPALVNTQTVTTPSAGYNSTTQHLAGSKHIEWFTREEISNGTAKNKGLISYQNTDNQNLSYLGYSLVKKKDFSSINGHIGAFMITNEQGITYHYALPAYSYDGFSFIGTTSLINTNKIEQSDKDPYAYQWMLTAITGNDYIDRNNNGLADESDWGYWISFGYGKWTDKHCWRTPDVGYVKDVDADNSTYSAGRKELYYLDYVKTRTHTALFVKDIRKDGKGVSGIAGGYGAITETALFTNGSGQACTENQVFYPVSTLKLNEIILLNNNDLSSYLLANSWATLNDFKKNGTLLNELSVGNNQCNSGSGGAPTVTGNFMNLHMGKNVFDVNDFTAATYKNLKAISIKTIQLNTDYSLCDGVPNSFDTSPDASYISSILANAPDPLKHRGKLTLKSIRVLGQGGADLMPATNFNYEVSNPKSYNMAITFLPGQLPEAHLGRIDLGAGNHPFVEGDLIKFTINNKQFYASLVKGIPFYNSYNNLFNVIFLGANIPVNADKSIYVTAYETKNPGYRRDGTDMWGMFKSDYDPSVTNINLAKAVSEKSAKSLDVWSLREIETPMGAKIKMNYEPDVYKTPALYNGTFNLNIDSITAVNSQQATITFLNNPVGLSTAFPIGSRCDVTALLQTYIYYGRDPWVGYFPVVANGIVDQVNSNSIVVTSPSLVTQIQNPHCCTPSPTYRCRGTDCSNGGYILSIAGGNIRGQRPVNIKGGGIRLSSVVVSGSGLSSEVQYSYESSNGLTSGVTTYEPVYSDVSVLDFPSSLEDIPQNELEDRIKKGKEMYRNLLVKNFSAIFLNAREIPGPGVMYEYVTMKEKANGINKPTYKKYQFEVFDPSMIKYLSSSYSEGLNNFSGTDYFTANRTMKIKDYTSRVGALKSIFSYDNSNKLVAKTTNKYLHEGKDDAAFESDLNTGYNNQGMVKQSFNEFKIANKYNYLAVTSTKEEYPLVNIASESYDYVKGVKKTVYVKEYDFYSGSVTKSWSKDSYDQYTLTENIPAYKKYPEMGLKVVTNTNRHMLSPSTASYMYKTDTNGNITGTLSASVNTWSKECNYRIAGNFTSIMDDDNLTVQNEQVWRPFRNYIWNSPLVNADGSYQNFVNFNWTTEANGQAQNKYWQRNSETTLHDKFSNTLEAKDINGNYVSTKMGYNNSRVIANATHAQFGEIAYTGAEDVSPENSNYFGGEVFGQTYKDAAFAHTGKYSIKLNPLTSVEVYAAESPEEIKKQKKYRISVWVHKNTISQASLDYRLMFGTHHPVFISGGSVAGNTSLPKAGDWYLLSLDFDTGNPVQAGFILYVTLSNTGSTNPVYFDDFRFHPVDASMNTYVYDARTSQVTHLLDDENFYTRFEYDAYGRLLATYKETLNGEKKVNDYYYNYARKP